jgi:chromate transport protein ChrA
MDSTHSTESASFGKTPSGRLRQSLVSAIQFWEPRRVLYNLILTSVAVFWLIATWPHFRDALTLFHGLQIAALGLIANACYCAAYFVDIPVQLSSPNVISRRWRWALWILGTVFAFVLTNYWIADEIYLFAM